MNLGVSGSLQGKKKYKWDLVSLHKGRTTLLNEGKPKYKARLVAKGCAQREGIDFHKVFPLVVKMTTLPVLFVLTTMLNLGFVVPNKEHLVCKLRRSMYGLKHTLRQWYKKFDTFMLSLKVLIVAMQIIVYTQKRTLMTVPSYLFYMWMICC